MLLCSVLLFLLLSTIRHRSRNKYTRDHFLVTCEPKRRRETRSHIHLKNDLSLNLPFIVKYLTVFSDTVETGAVELRLTIHHSHVMYRSLQLCRIGQ